MNEKKISAKILQSKSVKEYLSFASAVMSAVIEPQRLCDKIATKMSNSAFFEADDPIGWLLTQVEALILDHVSESVKNPLTRVQIGFDLAGIAGMTVGDVLDEKELEGVANEQ